MDLSDQNDNENNGLPMKGELLRQFETAVLMGSLDVEQVSLTESRVLASARVDSDQTEQRKKRDEQFASELRRINDYLRRIDILIEGSQARIALLEAQRELALLEAQEAFEIALEAEALLDAIADGVSTEERNRLIALLGSDAANATGDELVVLLNAVRDEKNGIGRDRSVDADDLAEEIAEEKRIEDQLRNIRQTFQTGDASADYDAMEQKLEELESRDDDNAPKIGVDEVSFDVPGFN